MAKKNKKNPEVHKDLDGFDIKINAFGEITSNFDVDKINAFLNEHVEDKKLTDKKDSSSNSEEE